MEDYNVVKNDFNEISQLDELKWNHNNCYFKQLMKLVPNTVETCLEIGCGKGELSFMLSKKSQKVIAVDLSDKMIERARVLYPNKNIDYICGNILDMKFENNSLDVIITTATAHHLPYEWLLCFAKNKLKKGGKLIILDLVKAKSFSDYIIWGSAFIPNIIMNLLKNGRLQKDDAHSKEVWERHGKHDTYMTMDEIKALAQKHIHTAKVKRKLFWRYSLVWQK
ncbi:methyltransferase type 11 [Clostridium carboxidivorans P7]|uniref:Methyltransferase type 11 n=1 Tax=Clostridium carboxidivorans P7 TaxID=536227 RepID=C6PU61_9CLOT|nr:class I SAM-dependent methyltransferase [Clostridium carboxidivorans]AKN33820.1 methyltransferase type 11 [Clostridium carboxidivorans P7]EET87261.1 Methyltransferase type 11 [Clostridium carboxidivorans P7]EFG86567.1 methyltransferase domain protein [Clostridium carboxidivorans P7]